MSRVRGRPVKPIAAEALIERTTRLFLRFGIRAVSVDAIATGSGITKPSFYRHFISKDRLIGICLESNTNRVVGCIAKLAQAAGSDPSERLQAIADGFGAVLASDELCGFLVLRAAAEFPEEGHPVHREVARAMSAIRGALQEALGSGRTAPCGTALADCAFLVILGAFAATSGMGPSPCSAALSQTIGCLKLAGLDHPRELSEARC